MKSRNGAITRGAASSIPISSSSRGRTPEAQAASNTGAITNQLRNSARLTISMFGGDCWRPMAERRMESTVTMKGKHVTVTASAGARLSSVTTMNSWMARSVRLS